MSFLELMISIPSHRWCLAALMGLGTIASTQAQNYDSIIEQLVTKGVLTVDESNTLREEADRGFTQSYAVHTGMPDWLNSMNVGGDLLVRYDGISTQNTLFDRQNLFSYRVRMAFTAEDFNQFETGIRLTSGDLERASSIRYGVDPITGQQFYENNASKKAILIDLAYLRWNAVKSADWNASLTAGKLINPFEMSELIFDRDYTPEGIAQTFSYQITDRQSLRTHLGAFVLDDIGSLSMTEVGRGGRDSYLFGGQTLHEVQWTPKFSTTTGLGWLAITHDQNLSPQYDADGFPIPGTGTPVVNGGNLRYLEESRRGQLVYGYNSWVVDLAATYQLSTFPGYEGVFPLRGSVELIRNTQAPTTSRDGYQIGMQMGQAGRKGTWQINYAYRVSEGDAWWDQMVDSNFGAFYEGPIPVGATTTRDTLIDQVSPYSDNPTAPTRVRGRGYLTGTNVRGNIISASYSPYDMLTLNITVYLTSLIQELPYGSDSRTARVQVNATVLF